MENNGITYQHQKSTWNAISHMLCAFQAVSQQLDHWLLWNSLCGKVKISYFWCCQICWIVSLQVTIIEL